MNYPQNINFNNVDNIILNQDSVIFICLYKINIINDYPYITYLLYKQKIQNTDITTFLYTHFTENTSNTFNNIDNILDNLSFKNNTFKGYLQKNNLFYLFYEYTHAENNIINKYNSNTILYWATIYEIVQMQSILNIPIHSTVFELFYSHPDLMYLYNHNQKIDFPITIYSKNNIIDLFSTYDNLNNCFIIKHESENNYHLFRCILIYYENKFSNINRNVFHFENTEQLQIISE